MGDFLTECANRANRPPIMNTLMRGSSAKYEADMKIMNDLVDECMFLSIVSHVGHGKLTTARSD